MGGQHVCWFEYLWAPVSRRRTPGVVGHRAVTQVACFVAAGQPDGVTHPDLKWEGTMLTLIVEAGDRTLRRRRRPPRPLGIAMPQLPLHRPTWLTATTTNEAKKEYRLTSPRAHKPPSLHPVSWTVPAGRFHSACKRKMPHRRQKTNRFPTFHLYPLCNDKTKRGGREP